MVNDQGMPVFVKIEEYRDVIDVMELIKSKIGESKEILARINQLKNEEDNELELWHNEIEDIENKIDFVDKSMFPPGDY